MYEVEIIKPEKVKFYATYLRFMDVEDAPKYKELLAEQLKTHLLNLIDDENMWQLVENFDGVDPLDQCCYWKTRFGFWIPR